MQKKINVIIVVLGLNLGFICCAYAKYEFLRTVSPKANMEIIAAFESNDELLSNYHINDNEKRLLHFLTQVATETGGFRKLVENMRYSPERLLKVFPKRIKTLEQAKRLAGDEVNTANYIYNGRLGNRKHTNDGHNYRGSGTLQLTGRVNFLSIGKILHKAYVNNPDLVRTPNDAIYTGLAFWELKNINKQADIDDIKAVRKAVNGGEIGLLESRIWYEKIKRDYYRNKNKHIPKLESGQKDEDEELNRAIFAQLKNLNYIQKNVTLESALADNTYKDGLKAFQADYGLKETSIADEDTIYKLTDPYGRFDTYKF